MCLAVPALVVATGEDGATVDLQGVRRPVNVDLIDGVTAGDWVLVHVGFALAKLDETEARETLALLDGLSEASA